MSLGVDIPWVGYYSIGLSSYPSSSVSNQATMFTFSWYEVLEFYFEFRRICNLIHLAFKIVFLIWLYWIRETSTGAFFSTEIVSSSSKTEATETEDDSVITPHDFDSEVKLTPKKVGTPKKAAKF